MNAVTAAGALAGVVVIVYPGGPRARVARGALRAPDGERVTEPRRPLVGAVAVAWCVVLTGAGYLGLAGLHALRSNG